MDRVATLSFVSGELKNLIERIKDGKARWVALASRANQH
jgi:hypothetical protein